MITFFRGAVAASLTIALSLASALADGGTPGLLTELKLCRSGEVPAGTQLTFAGSSTFRDRFLSGVYETLSADERTHLYAVVEGLREIACKELQRTIVECAGMDVDRMLRDFTNTNVTYIGQEYPSVPGSSSKEKITEQDYESTLKALKTLDPRVDNVLAPDSGSLKLPTGIELNQLAPTAVSCGRPDDNSIYRYSSGRPAWIFRSGMGSARQTLVEIHGYVTLPGESTVQGNARFYSWVLHDLEMPRIRYPWKSEGLSFDSVGLLLETQNSDGSWKLLDERYPHVRNIHGSYGDEAVIENWYSYDMQVSASVAQGTYVRMRLVTDLAKCETGPSWVLQTHVEKASLFGAQCYPDFGNPGHCLKK